MSLINKQMRILPLTRTKRRSDEVGSQGAMAMSVISDPVKTRIFPALLSRAAKGGFTCES